MLSASLTTLEEFTVTVVVLIFNCPSMFTPPVRVMFVLFCSAANAVPLKSPLRTTSLVA